MAGEGQLDLVAGDELVGLGAREEATPGHAVQRFGSPRRGLSGLGPPRDALPHRPAGPLKVLVVAHEEEADHAVGGQDHLGSLIHSRGF